MIIFEKLPRISIPLILLFIVEINEFTRIKNDDLIFYKQNCLKIHNSMENIIRSLF